MYSKKIITNMSKDGSANIFFIAALFATSEKLMNLYVQQ